MSSRRDLVIDYLMLISLIYLINEGRIKMNIELLNRNKYFFIKITGFLLNDNIW
jgi:hypothetical protein